MWAVGSAGRPVHLTLPSITSVTQRLVEGEDEPPDSSTCKHTSSSYSLHVNAVPPCPPRVSQYTCPNTGVWVQTLQGLSGTNPEQKPRHFSQFPNLVSNTLVLVLIGENKNSKTVSVI